MSALQRLLTRSTAIGVDTCPSTGEELVLWRTDKGFEFTTSYHDAATHGPKKEDPR